MYLIDGFNPLPLLKVNYLISFTKNLLKSMDLRRFLTNNSCFFIKTFIMNIVKKNRKFCEQNQIFKNFD